MPRFKVTIVNKICTRTWFDSVAEVYVEAPTANDAESAAEDYEDEDWFIDREAYDSDRECWESSCSVTPTNQTGPVTICVDDWGNVTKIEGGD